MFKIKQVSCNFAPIWRVFISGSSSAGKTYFAKQLLEAKLFKFERIYYFHPDIHEQCPTNWHEEISKPVIYQAGLPSSDDLLDLPGNSCIVLDDLFREAAGSKDIDYLFRVLSGKRKLHVIIMTQRYFAEGPYALSIRNSSNYHVLMNNADRRINNRAATNLGLKNDFVIAEKANKSKLYPYIVIDQTNQARVTGLQVFTDILSKHKEVIYNSMLGVWISKVDFTNKFEVIDQNTARHVHPKQKKAESRGFPGTNIQKEKSNVTKRTEEPRNNESRINESRNESNNESRTGPTRAFKKYLEKRRIARAVTENLQRRGIRSKL